MVRRGAFRYRCARANADHTLRQGWLLCGQPRAEFECSHDHDDGDDCLSLAINEELLWEVARSLNAHERAVLSTPAVLPPSPGLAALLEAARGATGVDLDEIGCFVAERLVCGPIKRPQRIPNAKRLRRVHDAIERIEGECSEALCLRDLAAGVGLSPHYFLRTFQKVSGLTPHQYLIGARLRVAVRLLLDTDRSVTRIAYEAGFADLSNFINTFRRAIGRSPGSYRRYVRANRNERRS
jgi:AraC-like DNA-binding protein